MPGVDPNHWLHRLNAEEWLAAATTELDQCQQALARRAFRPGITHARRAAGMALNAVLVLAPEESYGRSYMDHVRALAADGDVTPEVRAAAQFLQDTPALPPALVTLGKPDLRAVEEARRIIDFASERVAALTAREASPS